MPTKISCLKTSKSVKSFDYFQLEIDNIFDGAEPAMKAAITEINTTPHKMNELLK